MRRGRARPRPGHQQEWHARLGSAAALDRTRERHARKTEPSAAGTSGTIDRGRRLPLGQDGVGADREGADADDRGRGGMEAKAARRELVKPTQVLQDRMPAASSVLCTGRGWPLGSSMLTESMPTRPARRSTSHSAAAAVRKGLPLP
jgi:hypothetical protein